MFIIKLEKNTGGLFEATVTIPRKPKIVLGVEIPTASLRLTFSEDQIMKGQLNGTDSLASQTVETLEKKLGTELMRAKGVKVYQHS